MTIAEVEPVVETLPSCIHWFIIEPPNGPISMGKCKKCNEVREFYNSSAPTSSEYQIAHDDLRKG